MSEDKLDILVEIRHECLQKKRKLSYEMYKLDIQIKDLQEQYNKMEQERDRYSTVSNYLYELIQPLRKEFNLILDKYKSMDDSD
jgi:hypothetical protein